MAAKEETFDEFWRHYLRDHAEGGTRLLHVLGTGIGVLSLLAGLFTVNPLIALVGTGVGYFFAWAGHLLIERNRPAMVSHPAWSFQCDVRMFRLFVTGQLGPELKRAGVG
jgi:hypothetical protein